MRRLTVVEGPETGRGKSRGHVRHVLLIHKHADAVGEDTRPVEAGDSPRRHLAAPLGAHRQRQERHRRRLASSSCVPWLSID